MSDGPGADPRERDQAPSGPCKPWHAPQFIMMDLAATDTMCNAGGDGGPLGSLS